MAMTKVAEVVVGSGGSASIEFTNIPQTGKDLLLLTSLRSTDAGASFYGVNFGLNGGGFTDFTFRRLVGDGSTATSGGLEFSINAPNSTSNTFNNASIYISNYTNSTANKSLSLDWVAENNATLSSQQIIALRTTSTAAITSARIFDLNFAQHSSVSLYIIS